MRHVLVIDDDPSVCEVITNALQEWPDTKVMSAPDGIAGAWKLRERHFDFALIEATLAGVSGVQLAGVAASENTPVLIMSGHPDLIRNLAVFRYPYLLKPFSLGELLLGSREALAHAKENVLRIKGSVAQLQATINAGDATIAVSRELINKTNEPILPT